MLKNRINWIDYEKGFILLFVCLTHCGLYSPINGYHMAAFFFISGLLFNEKDHSISKYITRKVKSLLIPYILLSFLFLFLYHKLYDNFFQYFILYGNDIIQGYSSPNVAPLWFVYTLFQVSCLHYIINIFIEKKVSNKWWNFILSCICFIGGWKLNNVILPFKISTLVTSLSFYSLGVFLKDLYFRKRCIIPNTVSLFCLLSFFLLWLVGQKMVNGVIGYNNNSLGNTFIGYFLVSFFGIHFCTLFFFLCNKVKQNAITRLLKYIANNGIVILALHMFVINLCARLFSDYTTNPGYPYITACIMAFVLSIFIPLFNRYLPWMIGKY